MTRKRFWYLLSGPVILLLGYAAIFWLSLPYYGGSDVHQRLFYPLILLVAENEKPRYYDGQEVAGYIYGPEIIFFIPTEQASLLNKATAQQQYEELRPHVLPVDYAAEYEDGILDDDQFITDESYFRTRNPIMATVKLKLKFSDDGDKQYYHYSAYVYRVRSIQSAMALSREE